MKDLVEEVVTFLQVDMKYKDAQFIINSGLPDAFGDRGMIFQLLNNLLGNALKYSQMVEKPIIEIGFDRSKSPSVYYVKDNGIGFNNKYNEKIFGVFNRLVKDEFEGSGIGLAISQRVVDKHQGRIWAEGKVDNGATFYFQLPTR